jgi:ribosomal protein S12 methylthiotransferase
VTPTEPSPKPAVGLISLGCAKNLVDSEIMLGALTRAGYPLTNTAEEADILIVNTCSFIDSAKEESIDAIFDANRSRGLRRRSRGQKLVVAGCMAQRFQKELPSLLPEVDAFIGLDQVADLAPILESVWEGTATDRNFVTARPRYIPEWDTPRVRLTPGHFAYVKIAEGCNHPCSFCVIPQMRGRHRSRAMESIVKEARALVASGVRELNLISQDTTYFGMDRWEEKAGPRQAVDPARGETLIHLLEALDAIEGDFWIRLLYTHPAHWSDDLIACLARLKHFAKYVDMPLQHIHGGMLEVMRRETSEEHIVRLIARMRAGIPDLAIRTTFIVGFPGETEAHFERLLEFIEETRFDRLGVFPYSQEEGSRAAKLPCQVTARVKRARHDRAMALQQRLAREIQAARVGRVLRVLVDTAGSGRTEHDAPDIDGRVLFATPREPGGFVDAVITGATDYDLLAD